MEAFRITALVGGAIFAGGILAIGIGLLRGEWKLTEALKEPGDSKPSMSRILAIAGLPLIVALVFAMGYGIVWRLFTSQDITSLPSPAAFLTAISTIFAPYVANKIGTAIGSPAASRDPRSGAQ